jgi:hypothetical protein
MFLTLLINDKNTALYTPECICFGKCVSSIGVSNVYCLEENDNLFVISV